MLTLLLRCIIYTFLVIPLKAALAHDHIFICASTEAIAIYLGCMALAEDIGEPSSFQGNLSSLFFIFLLSFFIVFVYLLLYLLSPLHHEIILLKASKYTVEFVIYPSSRHCFLRQIELSTVPIQSVVSLALRVILLQLQVLAVDLHAVPMKFFIAPLHHTMLIGICFVADSTTI